MAQLPPKVPNIATNWPEKKPYLMEHMTTSWADEFLDFSSAKRGSHRRSMSDSVAFLEIPMVEEECRRSSIPSSNNVFDKFDDDQLIMSMFSDDINVVVASGGPNICCSNSSSPSDHNNVNDDDDNDNDNNDEKDVKQVVHDQHLKSEPEEVESCCKSEGQMILGTTHNGYMDNSKDKIVDPKRIKRILANRQSAQKSRVRKLQYVSELERVVTSLQAEVSVLSPRVAFLDHQRLVLGVDNSALKQRIAAMGQDKIFKDAHQEALKREIERLREVYYQQNMENNNTVENVSSVAAKPKPQPSQLELAIPINSSADKEQLAC